MNTEERYSRAISSSHLRADEQPGDIHTIIAASVSCRDYPRESLGVMLWRLKAEYDTAKVTAIKEAANPQTAMLLALMQLKTLKPVQAALAAMMVSQATRARFMEPDAVVVSLVGPVLQAFLHPQCFACGGRGTVGAYTKAQICRKCSGTGRRRVSLGDCDVQEHFCRSVLVEMERKCDNIARTIRRNLSKAEKSATVRTYSETSIPTRPQASARQSAPPAAPVDSALEADAQGG